MTYKSLIKQIKKDQRCSLVGYISYMANDKIISNFIDTEKEVPSDEQLMRAEKEGYLSRDWEDYIVIK